MRSLLGDFHVRPDPEGLHAPCEAEEELDPSHKRREQGHLPDATLALGGVGIYNHRWSS